MLYLLAWPGSSSESAGFPQAIVVGHPANIHRDEVRLTTGTTCWCPDV